eukprot:TRINITY_DN12916_c0_g1_i1.p1 TRINITY_DN12916_c0_g1~~TRINITY_DN12916_c0_g1_i1.p1  ORF type:complete len:181 (-),score=18.85 TRINITY_DN12916_c0_g1_i1:93-635(-)
MGTEILIPQDLLIERMMRPVPAILPRRKPYGSPKSSRKPVVRPESKKISSQSEQFLKRSSSAEVKPARNLVMGQVTILKRGKSFESGKDREFSDEDLILSGTDRLGPDPALVPTQIRLTDLKSVISPVILRSGDVYAGPAFSLSPSPSSLPFPTFSKKKGLSMIVDDSATKDLRRLLRID